ncbi:hypothetical protein N9V56_05530, partial [Alphaproteobacteria bacterium]|nr:hypothetical protein [Alphaproteobacteria bacterium]
MNKKASQMTQEELINKTIRRIYNRGKRKGYVSPEYIEKTIKNKNIPREKVEEILEVFKNEEVKVIDEAQAALMPVVKKKRGRKKGSTNKNTSKKLATGSDDLEENEDILGKTDDPVRMYLREMGGVELLSREGEIAIAKRIEASRSTMMVGIFGSPSSLDIISDWQKKLSKGDMLLREIIDCESTYNKTPEGKANVKTADNALDATSGKFMFSKNLVNSNFDSSIEEAEKEAENFNKRDQINNKENKSITNENQDEGPDKEDEDDEFLSLTSIEDIIKPSVDRAFKRIRQIKKSFL